MADPAFDFTRCGSSFSEAQANSWLVADSGSFSLGGYARLYPELVLFEIPKTAPKCTIPYKLNIQREGSCSYRTPFTMRSKK